MGDRLEDAFFGPPDGVDDSSHIEWRPVKDAAGFKAKTEDLLSDAMDVLRAKLRGGMAETGDMKTILEMAKVFKVGVSTVEEKVRASLEQVDGFELDETEDDSELRFHE